MQKLYQMWQGRYTTCSMCSQLSCYRSGRFGDGHECWDYISQSSVYLNKTNELSGMHVEDDDSYSYRVAAGGPMSSYSCSKRG